MENNREIIIDEALESVVGGLFRWHKKSLVLDYTHKDGTVTYHKVLDFAKGWELSNNLHGQNVPEDEILRQLISKGYIAG